MDKFANTGPFPTDVYLTPGRVGGWLEVAQTLKGPFTVVSKPILSDVLSIEPVRQ